MFGDFGVLIIIDILNKFLNNALSDLHQSIEHFKKMEAFAPSQCLKKSNRIHFRDLPFLDKFADKKEYAILEVQYNKLYNRH